MTPPTAELTRHVHVEHVMGTVASFDLRGDRRPEVVVAEACRRLHAIDRSFSTFRPDSEVCRLDRGEIAVAACGDDVRDVLAACERLHRRSGGSFDIRARGRLDPSAYVKGWAAEQAAGILLAGGIGDFCLTLGGDVVARGRPSSGASWQIGIQHPRDATALAAVVELEDAAVATSGLYERGEHIVDPTTGRAPRGVLSVTVTGPDLGVADALSTGIFARGPDAARSTLALPPGYEGMTITGDDRVLTTPGFPRAEDGR